MKKTAQFGEEKNDEAFFFEIFGMFLMARTLVKMIGKISEKKYILENDRRHEHSPQEEMLHYV